MNRWWKISPLVAVALSAASACNTKSNENANDFSNSSSTGIAPTPGPQPQFAQNVQLASPPPPISGGTMAIAADGRTIIASDPDRDQIYLVDIPSRTVTHTIPLDPGSEPGRVAVDNKGRAHVALRKSGNIATINLATAAITQQHVCIAPRGLAYDPVSDYLHIACAEGELVSIPFGAGEAKHVGLDRDLRDVIITPTKILVSRFREADVIELSRDTVQMAGKNAAHGGNLGWRMIAAPPSPVGTPSDQQPPTDQPAIVSQEPTNPTGTTPAGYYGSGANDACAAPTITSTRLDIPGYDPIYVPPAVLPVDLASNGREYAIVAAGNGHTSELPQVFTHTLSTTGSYSGYPASTSSSTGGSSSSSGFSGSSSGYTTNYECTQMTKGFIPGQAIAAVFDGDDQLIIQSREPASLFIMGPDRQKVWKEIKLSDVSREDTGHAIFHSNSGGFLACASCHAEGAEDGRTWHFVEGDRRTPSMRGTIANTAPYHWDGEMKNVRDLVDHVFVTRMSGPKVGDPEVDSLQKWLFAIPPPPQVAPSDLDAVGRGKILFQQHACASCHAGAEFTNNETRDVGTGGLFQVPSLIGVSWRAPFLHNGCAKTLKDRFGACGGDKHGDTATLTVPEIDDLTKYLGTL